MSTPTSWIPIKKQKSKNYQNTETSTLADSFKSNTTLFSSPSSLLPSSSTQSTPLTPPISQSTPIKNITPQKNNLINPYDIVNAKRIKPNHESFIKDRKAKIVFQSPHQSQNTLNESFEFPLSTATL
ncbi:hypothetical protein ACTFIT_008771, partial [Dictyostelium discoideum]